METNNENIVMEENEINTVDTIEEPIDGEVYDSDVEATEDKHSALGLGAGVIIVTVLAAGYYGGKWVIKKLFKKGETKTEEKEKKAKNRIKLTIGERVRGYVDVSEPEEEVAEE